MCHPVAVGIMAGAAVVGGGISAYGQYQQGKAAEKAAKIEKALAETAAKDAELRGEQDANRQRLATQQLIGKQKVGYAAAGVAIDSGTPVELMADTAMLGELDAQTIRNNAAREAWGYRTQGVQAMNAGRAARKAGEIGAFSSILGGGVQAASIISSGRRNT